MRYCSSCGTLNDTDAKFCAGCGKRLGAGLTEETTEPAAPVDIESTQEIPVPPMAEDTVMMDRAEINSRAEEPEPQVQPPVFVAPISGPEAPVQAAAVENKPNHSVKGKVFGIIGFVLGIESLIVCWVPYVNIFTLIESIIGLIFCNISKKNTDFKLARIGKTLNIIALIFSIVTIVLYFVLLFVLLLNYGDELGELISQATEGMVNITIGY